MHVSAKSDAMLDVDEGLAASLDVVWVAERGPDGFALRWVSPGAQALLGVAPEALTTDRAAWLALVDPADRRRVRRRLLQALRGQAGAVEHRLARPAGEERWVRTSFGPVVRDGVVVRLGGTVVDVSTTQRHHEELARAQLLRSLATLAGGLAHDVNNAMVTVMGHASLLEGELPGHPSAWRLARIGEAAREAGRLADQLLAYARGGKLQVTALDLGQLVGAAVDALGSPGVQVLLELPPRPVQVEGDPKQLLQLVSALLHNAVEASPHTGPVRVVLEEVELDTGTCRALFGVVPGRYARLVVRDHGVGMSPADRVRCFEPYYSTKGRGRGLGLAAAYGIATNHGGHVGLDSRPGLGTTVALHLPVRAGRRPLYDLRPLFEAAHEATPPAGEPPSRARRRCAVLLVDDEASILELLAEHLRGTGYTVVTARNGQEAVEAASAPGARFDAVFLDLAMPVLDGVGAFPLLRARQPTARFVISSGYDLDARAQRLLDQGADRFLPKPFRADVLAQLVDELVLTRA